jgi:formate dehydrogenase major subunit
MRVTRRVFLKISGTVLAASGIGINIKPVAAHAKSLKIKYARKTTTVCPYCSVGCSIIVSTTSYGKVINTEGDPDSPINAGALCSKGSSLYQLSAANPNRLRKPLYRAPYEGEWKEVSWEWALDKIAKNVKDSRDKSFQTINDKGQEVNRTVGIASVGSAAMDNEECYLYQKFLRGLGLVYIEHQARI